MKKLLWLTFIMSFTLPVWSNQTVNLALQEFAWEKRQLIVFTPSNHHPSYTLFLKAQSELLEDFKERKLQTWHIVEGKKVKLDEKLRDDLSHRDFQETFAVTGKDFKLLLIGYDQGVKLKQDEIMIDDLFAEIDQMPMRIQEMKESSD